MERRLAFTVAGAAALVITAGGAAVATNVGILDRAGTNNVGELDAGNVATLVDAPVSVAPPATDVSGPPTVESEPDDHHDDDHYDDHHDDGHDDTSKHSDDDD